MRSVRRRRWSLLVPVALLVAGCSKHAGQSAHNASFTPSGTHIAPENPDAQTELQAVVSVQGVDPSSCQYTWKRNGMTLQGETRNVLAPRQFQKGDEIEVEVAPLASGEIGRSLKASTRVGDAAPVVTSAGVTLESSAKGFELMAGSQSADPDGDPLTYSYQWFRNGERISGATDAGLPITSLSRGDRVVVEVMASDGERSSEPRRSSEFLFENRPPQFTSQPPGQAPPDGVLHYQAIASDPDGDPVRFDLQEAPAGATITPGGALEWTLPPRGQRTGTMRIVIRATDSKGGEATQTIELRSDAGARSATGA
jgi:hypothetical protein